MFGQTFYFSTIRKYVILVGTLFNDIKIYRTDKDGNNTQLIKVPILYGPKDKMLARVIQDPGIDRPTATLPLPMISFEMGQMRYDGNRKLPTINRSTVRHDNEVNKFKYQYNPVPYNFEFTLYAFVKYIDDGLQIIEQIVPYFTPFYTVTLNDIPAYGVKRDVPISLASITSEDQYQGDVAEDRIITWTFTFSAAGWVYPPVKDSSVIIKNIDVNFKDLDYEQTLTTVNVTIDPITANRNDTYEIITTITEGN